ncbi:MAG TPA: polysaccharide deacetylase family protein [Rhizomicrobium sp.]|nr:polysaccharide deacetylase family protein [Rhizomicrobium sp.]
MTGLAGRAFRQAARLVPEAAVLPFSRPAAVFFHGVETKLDDPVLQGNHHHRDTFIAIMRTLKRRFDVLPLAALNEVLKNPDRHSRALFLMADDGYTSMLDAAGILDELNLPWTLFVSTAHIGSSERNPIFRARAFLRYAPAGQYALPHLGRIDFVSRPRDTEEERIVALLKTLSAAQARETLDAMDDALAEAGLADLGTLFPSDAFLSWEQLKQLAAHGVAIGAHAHWHWPMNGRQTPDHLAEQATLSKRLIEQEIGACSVFAYPFGNAGDVTKPAWQAVREAGYEAAFTTLSGTLDASINRYLLPRHGIGLDETNIASAVAMLRAGNVRLQRWQESLR